MPDEPFPRSLATIRAAIAEIEAQADMDPLAVVPSKQASSRQESVQGEDHAPPICEA